MILLFLLLHRQSIEKGHTIISAFHNSLPILRIAEKCPFCPLYVGRQGLFAIITGTNSILDSPEDDKLTLDGLPSG